MIQTAICSLVIIIAVFIAAARGVLAFPAVKFAVITIPPLLAIWTPMTVHLLASIFPVAFAERIAIGVKEIASVDENKSAIAELAVDRIAAEIIAEN